MPCGDSAVTSSPKDTWEAHYANGVALSRKRVILRRSDELRRRISTYNLCLRRPLGFFPAGAGIFDRPSSSDGLRVRGGEELAMFSLAFQLSSDGGGGFGGPPGFLPRSRSSQNALRKKTPERLSMMRLSNRPSTVVIVPETIIQAIPASGIRPSTMETKSITASKVPPHTSAADAAQRFSCYGLNVASTVLLSFAASVTFWSCSPNFSCTKARA